MCLYEGNEIRTDILRIVKKFDIYICDLGEITPEKGNSLGKARPCVIIQSDDVNYPLINSYIIAPMTTKSGTEFTEESVEEYIQDQRNLGRIFCPIRSYENITLIDITQMRQIDAAKLIKYVGTIVNEELRTRINASLMEALFSRDEFLQNNNRNKTKIEMTEEQIQEAIEATKQFESAGPVIHPEYQGPVIKPKRPHTGGKPEKPLPNGFTIHYRLLKQGRTTLKELAEKCGMSTSSLRKKIKEFEKEHPDLVTSV